MAAQPGTYTSSPSIGLGIPVAERMTLQSEANMLLDQIAQANAIMDNFSPAPQNSSAGQSTLPLGQALAASRDQMQRLIERIDGLFQVVGQI